MATNLSAAAMPTPLRPVRGSAVLDPGPAATVNAAELLGVLRRNWWWIGLCALAAAIAAYAIAATLPKSFTAETPVAVAGDRFAVPVLQGALESGAPSDPMPQVRTEMQALGAYELMSGLVDELHLDRLPEFNGALRPPTLFGTLMGHLTGLFKSAPGPALPNAAHDGVVNAVSHAFAISQDGRSLVIDLTFTSVDPVLAATVVNRLVEDYIAKRSERLSSADTGANAAMNQRINQVRDDIAALEDKMQRLRASSGVVSLRAGSLGQQQIEDLATEESRAAVARSEIESNLSRATEAASSGSADELASVLTSPTISRLRGEEAQAAATVADMSAQFGASYPGLQSAEAHLASVRRQLGGEARRIVASLSMQLKAAQAHEAELHRQLSVAHTAGASAQDVQSQLDQLQQDIVTRRTLYGTLLASAQQTAAQPGHATLPDVRVLSLATPPSQPSAPKMKLVAGLGGLAGGLAAGLVAFVRGSNRPRFRTEAEIIRVTGANLLANVSPRALRYDPGSAGAGALRPEVSSIDAALRRLRSSTGGFPPRSVAIVGAQAGQQAADAALALARAAGHDKQPALLIEYGGVRGDFLKSHPEIVPAAAQPPGAPRGWRDALIHDTAHPLDLLIGFVLRAEPHHQTVALENLLVETREEYDLVVLGAPDARDPEALALARSCDATILVVDMGTAIPAATHAAASELATASRSSLGVIVLRKS